uniref:Uncharacterized protein n=1 Tax=Strongyloides papillosus TaxID=174720 RepID=A0A0N5BZP4_STREA
MTLRATTSTGQMNSLSFPYYHPQMTSTSSNTTTTSSSTSPGIRNDRHLSPSQKYQRASNYGTLIYSTSSDSQPNYFPKIDKEKIVEVTNLSSPPGKLYLI